MRGAVRASGWLAAAVVLLLALPVNSVAQVNPDAALNNAPTQFGAPAPRRRLPQVPARRGIGYRLFFVTDITQMAAAGTFEAVAGSPRLVSFGGGADVLRVWRGVFLHGGVSRATRTGERAVVFDKEAVGVGIPIDITMTPIEIGAGWRTESGRTRAIGAYAGGGLLRLGYRETSTLAGPGDNVNSSFTGYLAFGGVDFTKGKRLVIGAEAQYRGVPNAIGATGASLALHETNLGGMTARVLVGIRK